MASFSTISIRFNADLKQFSSEIQNAQRKMDKVGQKMQSIGAGLTLGVTLPILGIGTAAVKAASDAEETKSKFQTVFRDVSDAAKKSADVLRNSYGLSSKASQQLLGDTGDLLTGFGFSQTAALDLSTEVNKLAVDLASFTNFSGGAEGASQALTKALLGERESLKSLGIAILESDVQAKMLQQAQEGLTFETERQAKAFATLTIAQEQSKNAIGDYERTSGSFANQMRLLKSRLNDVAVQFGEILLPYVQKLAVVTGKLLEKFSELSPVTKKVIVVIGLLVAALGPLLVSLGFLLTSIIPGLITGFTYLTTTIIPALSAKFAALNVIIAANPIGVVVTAVAALVYGFTELIQTITPAVSKLQTFYNLVKSGGSYSAFVAAQMRDQAEATAENAKAAEEATGKLKALDKMNKILSNNQYDPIAVDPLKIEDSGTNPIKEKSRAIIASITELKPLLEPIQNSPLSLIAAKLPTETDLIRDQLDGFKTNIIDISDAISNSFAGAIANTAQFMGDFLGALVSGNAGAADLFKGLIGIVGSFLETLGQALISAGTASLAFKSLFANPIAAIGVGAALIAFSGVITSLLSSGLDQGSRGSSMPRFADGGIVYGPTVGLMGEYSGARTNPEVIAPLNKLKDLIGDSGGGGYIADVKLKGQDLVMAFERTNAYRNRRN